MRLVIASTFLVLLLGASSCTRTTQDSQFGAATTISPGPSRSVGAAQLLETLQLPQGFRALSLSASAENQLQRIIFDDVEIAASVRDVAATGLSLEGQPIGALMLIGVADPVIGNMSFVEGLKSAALIEPETAHWGPMTGSVMQSDGQVWGVLPLSSVVAVAVTVERVQLNEVMNSLVQRVTRP
jgi:hypothetical protein